MKEESSSPFIFLGLLLVGRLLSLASEPGLATPKGMEDRLQEVENRMEIFHEKVNFLEDKVEMLEDKISALEMKGQEGGTGISMETSLETLMTKVEEHEERIQDLRDPPTSFVCAYQSSTSAYSSTVAYESTFYSRTNQAEGGLSLYTGVYTAPVPGTYTITYSLYSYNDYGK